MVQKVTKNSFLIFANIIFFAAIVYSLFESKVGNHDVSNFIFPDRVYLNSWHQIKTDSTGDEVLITSESKEKIASGKYYYYVKNDLSLNVRVAYVINTRGNVNQLITTQTNVSENVLDRQKIKKHDNLGFYSLFHDREYAYLSSCVDSQGKTIVTPEQFSANLNQIKINPSLLGKWLMGKASIRDRRCIWLHMSVPLRPQVDGVLKDIATHKRDSNRAAQTLRSRRVDNSYAILENTWIDLVEWWSPNFPPL